jgi:predicted component of type VI protein secretion system
MRERSSIVWRNASMMTQQIAANLESANTTHKAENAKSNARLRKLPVFVLKHQARTMTAKLPSESGSRKIEEILCDPKTLAKNVRVASDPRLPLMKRLEWA